VPEPSKKRNEKPTAALPSSQLSIMALLSVVDRVSTTNTVLSALCKNLNVSVLLGIDRESLLPSNRSTAFPPCTLVFRSGLFPLVACVACLPFPDLSSHLATAPSAATSEPPDVASKRVSGAAASSQSCRPLTEDGLNAVGVTVEYAPVPIPLIAATLKIYACPLVNPVTVAVTDVDTERIKVVHVDPELVLY
jgi:hypothetical protein